MDTTEVTHWFDSYLADFVALGRGDIDDVRRILAHYGVPLLLGTDAGGTFLTDEAQVLALAQQQIDGMRSAGYDRSDELGAETTIVNRSCAIHRARFSRRRADGSEIAQIEATYLITDGPAGAGSWSTRRSDRVPTSALHRDIASRVGGAREPEAETPATPSREPRRFCCSGWR
jgi:hypothetical protein